MANFYIYFISSLPMLHFGIKPPFSFEKFIEMAERFIPCKDIEILKKISMDLKNRDKDSQRTLKKWYDFDNHLRNELVKVRAAYRHIDPAKYIRDYRYQDISLERLAVSAHRNPSILEGERILDETRWQLLEELVTGHYFDLDFLIIYAVKLLILEKWVKINTADKMKVLEEVLQKE